MKAADGTGLRPLEPVATAHLFPGLHDRLVSVLRGLSPADWTRPTVAGSWRVRDVAAHLLDVQVRRLSLHRDEHRPPGPERLPESYDEVVAFLNDLNAAWVGAMQRSSPAVLLDLLDVVGPRFADFMGSLDPDGTARFAVAWAGEETSRNWFDVGRDYTELWHHQAQIRMAVGADPLENEAWLGPVIALAVRGLGPALGTVERPPGTSLVLSIPGEGGGAWTARRGEDGWGLYVGAAPSPAAEVTVAADRAWRLFFNALSPGEAARALHGVGDDGLVEAVLRTRSVMVRPPGPDEKRGRSA